MQSSLFNNPYLENKISEKNKISVQRQIWKKQKNEDKINFISSSFKFSTKIANIQKLKIPANTGFSNINNSTWFDYYYVKRADLKFGSRVMPLRKNMLSLSGRKSGASKYFRVFLNIQDWRVKLRYKSEGLDPNKQRIKYIRYFEKSHKSARRLKYFSLRRFLDVYSGGISFFNRSYNNKTYKRKYDKLVFKSQFPFLSYRKLRAKSRKLYGRFTFPFFLFNYFNDYFRLTFSYFMGRGNFGSTNLFVNKPSLTHKKFNVIIKSYYGYSSSLLGFFKKSLNIKKRSLLLFNSRFLAHTDRCASSYYLRKLVSCDNVDWFFFYWCRLLLFSVNDKLSVFYNIFGLNFNFILILFSYFIDFYDVFFFFLKKLYMHPSYNYELATDSWLWFCKKFFFKNQNVKSLLINAPFNKSTWSGFYNEESIWNFDIYPHNLSFLFLSRKTARGAARKISCLDADLRRSGFFKFFKLRLLDSLFARHALIITTGLPFIYKDVKRKFKKLLNVYIKNTSMNVKFSVNLDKFIVYNKDHRFGSFTKILDLKKVLTGADLYWYSRFFFMFFNRKFFFFRFLSKFNNVSILPELVDFKNIPIAVLGNYLRFFVFTSKLSWWYLKELRRFSSDSQRTVASNMFSFFSDDWRILLSYAGLFNDKRRLLSTESSNYWRKLRNRQISLRLKRLRKDKPYIWEEFTKKGRAIYLKRWYLRQRQYIINMLLPSITYSYLFNKRRFFTQKFLRKSSLLFIPMQRKLFIKKKFLFAQQNAYQIFIESAIKLLYKYLMLSYDQIHRFVNNNKLNLFGLSDLKNIYKTRRKGSNKKTLYEHNFSIDALWLYRRRNVNYIFLPNFLPLYKEVNYRIKVSSFLLNPLIDRVYLRPGWSRRHFKFLMSGLYRHY